MAEAKLKIATRRNVLRSLGQPKVAVMLMLGFSSGLPFMLSANTLGYWLREVGITLQAIGFLSWVGLAYSLKFLWAPVVDRVDAPLFGRLGRRRGWMLLTQLLVAAGLIGLALRGPAYGLAAVGVFALVVAFSSATQDIVVDAWRIEASSDSDELGLLSSAYQLGYRAALLLTDALILLIANHFSWPLSYLTMAVLMVVGCVASLVAVEPARAAIALDARKNASLWSARGLIDAIVGPFVEFFRVHGRTAIVMLAAISLYRLPEYFTGPMYNPFYHDIGLSKDAVGAVRGSIGLVGTLAGVAASGFAAVRFGYMRTLIFGVIIQNLTIASFAILSYTGPSLPVFGAIMAADNFAGAFAGVALVTYMSSLTSLGYTATQYALLSSTYAYLGKFAKGLSGVTVEWLATGRTLIEGYALFFMSSALLGVPALLLCIILARIVQEPATSAVNDLKSRRSA
jgi:MFS transporter, PAT family, beta-lactamase induction signal transducer AmpG